MDISSFTRDTGWKPEHDIYAGMAAYMAWLKDYDV